MKDLRLNLRKLILLLISKRCFFTKPNFSSAEVAVLTKFIKTHKEELFRKLLPSLAKQKKDNGAVGNVSPVRFARDTENKIYK